MGLSREGVWDRLGCLWRRGGFGGPRVRGSFDGLCQGESGFGASLGARGRMSDRMTGSVREHGSGSRDRLGSGTTYVC